MKESNPQDCGRHFLQDNCDCGQPNQTEAQDLTPLEMINQHDIDKCGEPIQTDAMKLYEQLRTAHTVIKGAAEPQNPQLANALEAVNSVLYAAEYIAIKEDDASRNQEGERPQDVFMQFMESIQNWESGIAGSPTITELVMLDDIYAKAEKAMRRVLGKKTPRGTTEPRKARSNDGAAATPPNPDIEEWLTYHGELCEKEGCQSDDAKKDRQHTLAAIQSYVSAEKQTLLQDLLRLCGSDVGRGAGNWRRQVVGRLAELRGES